MPISLIVNNLSQNCILTTPVINSFGLSLQSIVQGNLISTVNVYNGTLTVAKLTQPNSLVITPSIYGFLVSLTNVQTIDLSYLASFIISEDTTDYLLDNYPYHNFYQSLDLVNLTLVTNTLAAAYTYPILGGIIDASFFGDYYNRLHFTPNPLNLGQVVNTYTVPENVWNAFLVPTTLSSITATTLPDVTITLPSLSTLPFTFKPLQNIIFSISASQNGVASIKGNFNFITSTFIYPLYITGTRALFWPFNSISSFKESRTYLTDNIKCFSSEQRFTLREKPRLTINYNYKFLTNEEFSFAKILGRKMSALPISLALWTESIKVTNLLAGQLVIPISLAGYEYEIGSTVVFWKSYTVWETGQIVAIATNSFTLHTALIANFSSCWVAPVYTGYAEGGIKIQSEANYKKTGAISITCTSPFCDPVSFFSNTFLGLPLLELPIIVSGGINNNYSKEQQILDADVGILIKIDNESYTRESSTINLFSPNHASLHKLRRGFDYLKGKYQAFWLPSNQRDMQALTALHIGDPFILIANGNFTNFPIPYIRIIGTNNLGDTSQCFTIALIEVINSTTEKITFTTLSTVDMVVSEIQILTKVRLDTDTINYDHQARGITNISVAVIEVLT